MMDPPRETHPVRRSLIRGGMLAQHPGMYGKIVHTLLALLDKRVAINVPGKALHIPIDFSSA